jgi:hypothetical protein
MSYDIDDTIYDVPFPEHNSTLEQIEAFESLQNSDPLNIALSVIYRFKFIIDELAPSLGCLIEKPEYHSNFDFQFKAMKLCFYGLGNQFDSTHPYPVLHLTELIEEAESVDPEFFLHHFVKFFRGGEYLLSRSWYTHYHLHQLKTIILGMTGFGNQLLEVVGDYDYELNRLLRRASRYHKKAGYNPHVYLVALKQALEWN